MLFPHLRRIVLLDHVGYNYRFGGVTTKYNKNLFGDMLTLYRKKKQIVENTGFDKARDFIIIEMVNVLRSEVCQCIRYNQSPTDIKAHIRDLLDLDIWRDIEGVSQHPQWLQKPFTRSVIERDVDGIYDQCLTIEKSERLAFHAKRLISKLLSFV